MTVEIKHSLHFVTVVDETHPGGLQLLGLSESAQITVLESMLKDLLVPFLKPEIDRINEHGTYAILKVAD